MHDPKTVAFEIKSPIRRQPDKLWPRGYRPSLITIWHVDPLKFEGKCGCRRDDDSCGWFTPPYSPQERERIIKLGRSQYRHIWEKQIAVAEGKSYAHICFYPTPYDAIYWTWRAIKFSTVGHGWMYGERRPALTASELEQIYLLSANPVDNLQGRFAEVQNEETYIDWFLLIYGLYLRHNRPWYKHPRWHFWHWQLQVHPWQTLRRWLFTRCAGCGKRFAWGASPTSFSWDTVKPKPFCSEVGLYHDHCANFMRVKPEGTA